MVPEEGVREALWKLRKSYMSALGGVLLGRYLLRHLIGIDPTVLILDGNSEMCAPTRSNLCYWISLRHMIRTSAV